MSNLYSLEETTRLITEGIPLLLAADEALLSRLPRGKWIGGTTPYFMTDLGGREDHNKLFVTVLPAFAQVSSIKNYSVDQLPLMPQDYASNGCSFIILPATSQVHLDFARDSASYEGVFDTPLAGWISGVHLSDLGKVPPKVVDGQTGVLYADQAIVMHIALPPEKVASIDIINLFNQGAGDVITFPETGFEAKGCLVNGSPRNLAGYIKEKGIDTKLPLVADYSGASINVSIQAVDTSNSLVRFYAAVFSGTEYRFAEPVPDYQTAFAAEVANHDKHSDFSCNCILNYLYAGLEGKPTRGMTGPITFGEVAYILLNQTLVYVSFEDI
jgi:hypothetical protein